MAQKSCLYLYHCLQGQMHYLILNSKICEVAHSAHSNSLQPTFPSCHGPDMNRNSPWRREEEVGGLGSILPTINSPSEHTWLYWCKYLSYSPPQHLDHMVTAGARCSPWISAGKLDGIISRLRGSVLDKQADFFSPLKTKIIEKNKTKQARQCTHPMGLVPALLVGVFVVLFSSSDNGVTQATCRAHWSLHSRCVCLCAW